MIFIPKMRKRYFLILNEEIIEVFVSFSLQHQYHNQNMKTFFFLPFSSIPFLFKILFRIFLSGKKIVSLLKKISSISEHMKGLQILYYSSALLYQRGPHIKFGRISQFKLSKINIFIRLHTL